VLLFIASRAARIASEGYRLVEMANRETRLLTQILRGTSDANISFAELCRLLRNLEFEERTCGDHHIFTREGVEEILNLQPRGAKAKPYQVKQVRNVILLYRLGGEVDV